jgi:hypothetical protein
MTPRQWAVVKIPSVTFLYFTVEDHSKETMMIKDRFRKAATLLSTQKIHCVIPVSKTKFR